MSSNIDVTFNAKWKDAGEWSGALDIEMVNNTGSTLVNPKIKIQLGQYFTASENTGYDFIQEGDILTGHLQAYMANVENGAKVKFAVGASFPNGGNQSKLPVAYWVDGMSAINGDDNPDVTAPSAPQNLKSLSVTASSATLAWDAASDDVGVDHYVVHYQASGELKKNQTAAGTSATLANLQAATAYTVSVTAVDAAGNTSEPSSSITVTTDEAVIDVVAPSVPADLAASTITDSSIALSWSASTDNVAVTGYKVKYTPAGGVSKTVNVTGTACLLSDLASETEYSCCVAAFDASNNLSAYSAAVVAKTLAPVVTSLTFAPYVDVTINADWSTNPPGINTRYVNEALALGVKSFHLAFLVQDSATKALVWGNSYFPYNAIKPICDSIHAAGAEAIVAFGGASGIDPSVSRTQAEMTKIYLDLNKDYGIRHIDFDFETAGYYNYQVAFPAALEAMKQNPELWFSLTLPVMPTGLTAEGIAMITYASQIGLPLNVQIMAMDYGQAGIEMGDAAISAIEGTKNNLANVYPGKSAADLYKLIGVIPMIGQNDVAGEMFTFPDATKVAKYANQKGLNLISMWSLTRDFPSTGDLTTSSMNPAQTKNYEYTTTILDALK